MDRIVVVGGGLAGVSAIKALRSAGFQGEITLLAKDPHPPYDRPPLSKEVLLGTADDPYLVWDVERLRINVRADAEATALTNPDGQWIVHMADGHDMTADRVVIAVGSRPLTLPVLEAHPHNHTLRTLDDAHSLRAALRRRTDVVVIGAGWIGAEVASAATSIGCNVHVVDSALTPVSRAFELELGNQFLPWYRQAGAELLLGRQITAAGGRHVELDDGTTLAADIVVNGIGVTPDTSWLASSPVELDPRGAVLVDEFLESVSAPGVYAIGDCASYPSTRYSARLRPEHWANAQQAGSSVAATLAGHRTVHDPVPYFWSKQFGRMLQYVGHHREADALRWRGDPTEDQWTAYWVDERSRPTAFLSVNRPRDAAEARRLLAEDAAFDLATLTRETASVAESVVAP